MLKALIIDDSEISQKLIGKTLETLDLNLFYASDGQEALDIISKKAFDFIVTDLSMPQVDGYQLVKLVRTADKSTPIYIITSSPTEDLEDRLYLMGGDAVFHKDNMEEFRKFVREKIATSMKVID